MNTKTATKTNAFVNAVNFKTTTFTENGAVTNVTTGSALVDQFGKAGNFRGRTLAEVFADQATIWAENPEAALRFPFYLRMVTVCFGLLKSRRMRSTRISGHCLLLVLGRTCGL